MIAAPTLLSLRAVHAAYGAATALSGISFDVRDGSAVGILGANGAGKTTIFRLLYNLLRWTGEVRFDGQDVSAWPEGAAARNRIAHVPDGRGTFGSFSVIDNLRLGAYTRPDKAEVDGSIEEMFGLFPRLRERYRQEAGMLSGGEQQMLAIARALMAKPRLLLLDEPSFGIAPKLCAEIMERLSELKRSSSMTFLVAEQNAEVACAFADTLLVLETGRVVFDGTPRDLRASGVLASAYLGMR